MDVLGARRESRRSSNCLQFAGCAPASRTCVPIRLDIDLLSRTDLPTKEQEGFGTGRLGIDAVIWTIARASLGTMRERVLTAHFDLSLRRK